MTTVDRPPLEPGLVVALSGRLRRVLCPNPSMMTGPGTNSYVVGTDDLVVIDPGPDHVEHVEVLARVGARPDGTNAISRILCTHTHGDHSPGAARLAELTGAEVLAYADRDGLVCDRHLVDGDVIEGSGFRLRVIHTPGHASNHICFLLEEESLLLSGDHVMDGSTVVITPLDGDMGQYLAAVERLRDWVPAIEAIAPAHGHLITDPRAKLSDYLTHRLEREQQVEAALVAAGEVGAGTAALVAAIYTEVPEILHPVARFSVWAHLRKLADEGRARSVDADDPDATWFSTEALGAADGAGAPDA